GYGLGSGDAAVLYTPMGDVVDSHSWLEHVASSSRCPDGFGTWISPTPPTPGASNDCPAVAGEGDIVINEVNSQGDDFVELLNVGASDVDVSGWVITDSDPTHVFTFPSGTVIPS